MAEFIKHIACEKCGSSDGCAVYADDSTYCFSCEKATRVKPDKPEPKVRSSAFVQDQPKKDTKLKESITQEKAEEIKGFTAFDNSGYRGITKATNQFFGVRYAYNDKEEIEEVYYPITRDGELAGYKLREIPKIFSAIGATGNDCDLFGAFRFQAGGKYLLIVEGEHDAMAGYQMLKDYNESKNSPFVTAVVSITTGAANPTKQLQANYDFINSFEIVILGFDSDKVGQEAMDKVMNCLPKGKVRVAKWTRFKDPNEYLEKNAAAHFIMDFYNAKAFIPAGVVSSSELYDKIRQQSIIEKVTLPPFAFKLQEMLGGGLTLGHIYNLAAQTGAGKTSVVNEFIYYWIFNSPHMIGVVSMELNAGQYGEALLSRHIEQKLARLSVEEKGVMLDSSAVIKKGQELFLREDGTPRFYLVEDRDGTVEQLQDTIEEMVISSGVKIVVLDVLQDILEGMSNEDQGLFMKWCKSMIKSHGVSFVLINHMRKTSGGTNTSTVTEDDIHGSSTIMKSASANILLKRDKAAEDDVDRNTTEVILSKNRLLGETGPAGKWYYDKVSHVMHDFDTYFETHERPTPKFPQGPAGSEF